jgi:DNA-binding GntR family transcriptional regulator
VPGDRLPSELEIVEMTGVSLMTVRRAMSELVTAGTLQRVQGKGTFLRTNRVQTESTIIGGLKQTLALQGVQLDTKLLSIAQSSASARDAASLSVPAGTATWNLVRVRYFDAVPVVRERAVIPRILAPDLDVRFTATSESLYEILSTHYGLTETFEEQSLIARPATDTEIVDLTLGEHDFVIEVTGVSTSTNGIAFDSFEMTFVPNRFVFRLRSRPTADLVDFLDPAT